jgi:hypothetical protein
MVNSNVTVRKRKAGNEPSGKSSASYLWQHQSVQDLFLDDFSGRAAENPYKPTSARNASPGPASLVSSLALLLQTETFVAQNLSAEEVRAIKAAFAAMEDALAFTKALPGVGTALVDMADTAVVAAEEMMKTGASVLLGSSVLPMLEAVGGGRIFDIGAKLGGRDEALCALVQQIVDRVKALGVGQVTIVPCGWARTLCEVKGATEAPATGSTASHCLLIVVAKASEAEYSVAVCNTGEGREMHPARVASPTGQDQGALSVYLRGVACERVLDGSFWYMLMRPLVYPSTEHTPHTVYRLLPFLNNQPLTSKAQTLAVPPADWSPIPASGDPSHGALVH